MKKKDTSGFTIVELLLATTVFSLVLLAALVSFLEIGHLFYKGVTLTNTQNIATSVVNDISNSMQIASAPPSLNNNTGTNGYIYNCIGNTRYTYTTKNVGGKVVSVAANLSATRNYSSGPSATFGLLKDTLPGSAGCAAPCARGCGNAGFDKTNPTEMLGDQMRAATLSITQTNASQAPNLYNVSLVVAYGEDSILNFSSAGQPTCVGNSQKEAFCSVVSLSTVVFKGVRS